MAALRRAFQSAGHQRCRVHFARNLLAHVPKAQADYVAAAFRTIFAQATPAEVDAAWNKTREEFAAPVPQARPADGRGQGRGPGLHRLPSCALAQDLVHQRLERVKKEIKLRSRVVGIFPNASVIRLVGAILIDMHDEWIADDRRYLSEGSMAKLHDTSDWT